MKQENSMQSASQWHVCGLVVQCRPEKLAQVQKALLVIENTEIPAVEAEKGKLVVVMQSHHQRQLLNQMEDARNLEGVINVSLVYHEEDLGSQAKQ